MQGDATPTPLDEESGAVQKHLEIVQGVISRMAENSRSCKVWNITLVAAVLVLVARTGKPEHALIALAPTALFYLQDAYYRMLERRFRKSYNSFVGKVHAGEVRTADLYAVIPEGSAPREMIWSMFRSLAVWPFYAVIVATVLLAWQVVL